MPNEVFFCNEHPANVNWEKLSIGWSAAKDSVDPKVCLSVRTRPRTQYHEANEECCTLPPQVHPWRDRGNYDLDREAINKLIRVLRRARDQVYGKDE